MAKRVGGIRAQVEGPAGGFPGAEENREIFKKRFDFLRVFCYK
jgi:hypothetical protein